MSKARPKAKCKRGRKASLGGQLLEMIPKALSLKGFTVYERFSLYRKRHALMFDGERLLIAGYKHPLIYGTSGHSEWKIESPEWTGFVECKYQYDSGSVDEKFPYIVETIRAGFIRPLIVIHAGNWWTDSPRGRGAIDWLKRAARSLGDGDLQVFDVDGFIAWVKRTWQ